MNNRALKLFSLILFVAILSLAFTTFASAKSSDKCICSSPCECEDENGEICHGSYRWDIKTDNDMNYSDVQSIKPSDVGNWAGPGKPKLGNGLKRLPEEEQWYSITGKVTFVKGEKDGDLHIQMIDQEEDISNIEAVNVVVEVPYGDQWCEIRKNVFEWTKLNFPHTQTGNRIKLIKTPIITVTGKAFYDGAHGGEEKILSLRVKDQSIEGRPSTVWEIHPVMKMDVVNDNNLVGETEPKNPATTPGQ